MHFTLSQGVKYSHAMTLTTKITLISKVYSKANAPLVGSNASVLSKGHAQYD